MPPAEKDAGLYHIPSPGHGVTAIVGKGSPKVQARIEEEPVGTDPPQGELTDDEIRQRTPPNQSLQSDGQHSYPQGSILNGDQIASQAPTPRFAISELTVDEICQRTPPNQSLQSDGQHSYHQGSILSGKEVASPALTLRPAISEAIDDEIRQRTPPNQSLQSDSQHSYQQESILRGKQVASQGLSPCSAISETTVGEICQRTPPNESFQSDGQHSYQQWPILSGKQVPSQALSPCPAIGETTDDEIRQRTPPNRSLKSDDQQSNPEGSILSGEQVASPCSDPYMLPLVPHTPTQGDRPPDALQGSQVVFKSGPQPIQKINNLPDEWKEDIHPEGQLLYSKVVSSGDLNIRVHTDLPLRSTENHPVILAAFGRLSQLLESSEELHNAQLKDSEVEACILVSDDFPDEFGYYLVNHRDQTTFWLQEVPASDLDMWAYDEDIYRHKLAEQYWRHSIRNIARIQQLPRTLKRLPALRDFGAKPKKSGKLIVTELLVTGYALLHLKNKEEREGTASQDY
ncbi:hypothetical protein FRC05_011719 [Tulasnella sp. 425]|nr:hypothetical protein FRC05_011719 [Tulasnella sp. 425]